MNKDGKSNSEVSQELAMGAGFLLGALVIFPVFVFSIPLFIIFRLLKKPNIHLIFSILGLVVFGFTVSYRYESYLGLYGTLPFDWNWLMELTGSTFPLVGSSYVLYVSGGLVLSYGLHVFTEYQRSKRVNSKEKARERFKEGPTYEKVYQNRFKINERVQKKWRSQKVIDQLLLGINEDGQPYYQDFKEINQHMFLPATTGGGKTVLLLNYIEYALIKHYPFIFIDGKGSSESIEDVQTLCHQYGKEVIVFSDQSHVTYNPLKHGNATVIRDKLEQLIETESTYYTEISLSLVQALIQFIDDYGFKRDLWTFARFLDPNEVKKVLNQDLVEKEEGISPNESQDEEPYVPSEEGPKPNIDELLSEEEFSFGSYFDNESTPDGHKEQQQKEAAPAPQSVRPRLRKVRSERAEKHHHRLFQRYKNGQEGEMYLFSNASSVRTQIHLLLDGELGFLFKETEDGLDLIRISEEKEALFVSFDGLIYDKFIKVIARFLILDINYLVSYRNRKKMKDEPFLAIYDEFSVYANDKIVDTINKSRSGGFHCIIATQTLADLETVDPILAKQVVANTNTYGIGQTNHPDEVEAWANTLGTYKDIDLTVQTEKQEGRLKRIDQKAGQGTVREVRKYHIKPDEIRQLRTGQFIFDRKAGKKWMKPEIIYVRHPLKGF
ncbi:TraM recognition domain-containing protein [Alkalihalobacillus sp. TS-13]|uniref:TraM recognition domain-containing protein n=1 Tax=Alkalihalobacillus sp. TS-13 TaxID=2842455 RepID=UPI001C86DD20|nr:TraM recognition domain-containing protein [Alkalihalobacillus sp. TS-13]